MLKHIAFLMLGVVLISSCSDTYECNTDSELYNMIVSNGEDWVERLQTERRFEINDSDGDAWVIYGFPYAPIEDSFVVQVSSGGFNPNIIGSSGYYFDLVGELSGAIPEEDYQMEYLGDNTWCYSER